MKLSPVKQASLFSVEDGGHMFLITSEWGNTIALFNQVLDPVHLDSAWHFATIPSHKQRQGNPKPVNNPCFCFTTDFWAWEGEPQSSLQRNLIMGSVGQRPGGDGHGNGPMELHYGIIWRVRFHDVRCERKSTLGSSKTVHPNSVELCDWQRWFNCSDLYVLYSVSFLVQT